jgi:beta-lactamase regulating signal transducer with metallopeptidase domain
MLDGEVTRVILAGLRDAVLGLATRGSILFGLAFLGTRAARSLGPERRHTVWLVVILVLAVMPAARIAVPLVRLPLMDALGDGPQAAAAVPAPPRASVELLGDGPVGTPMTWVPLALAAAWLAGTLTVAARPVMGRVLLGRMSRTAESRSGPTALLDSLARSVGVHAAIVLSHPRVTVPFTFGLRRPRIFLPPSWTAWPREKLEAVLLHELAHLKRGDARSNLAAQAACALLWFNPLVWIGRAFLRRDAELSCDREVLAHGISRSAYAAALVEIARDQPGVFLLGTAAAMAGRGTMRDRIQQVLVPAHAPRPSSARLARGAAAALCALSPLLFLSVSLQGSDPLVGTWGTTSASRPFYDSTLTLNEDGSGQTTLDVMPEMPTSFCRYVIERKWKDSQGNLYYHVRARWSDTPFLLYTLIRVGSSGTRFEMADSPTGYPAEFLGPPGSEKHLVYIRR